MNQFNISGMQLNAVLSAAEVNATNQLHTVDRVRTMLINACEEQLKFISEAHMNVVIQFKDDDEIRMRLHRCLGIAHRNIAHVANSLMMSEPTTEELKEFNSCIHSTKTTLNELFNSINFSRSNSCT